MENIYLFFRILIDYMQYSYYGSSTALLMYELPWKIFIYFAGFLLITCSTATMGVVQLSSCTSCHGKCPGNFREFFFKSFFLQRYRFLLKQFLCLNCKPSGTGPVLFNLYKRYRYPVPVPDFFSRAER